MTDASAIGRRNRNAGASAERELCRWLNDIFDIGAKTSRSVGHGTQSLCGDIVIPGHPEIVIEVKNTQITKVAAWLDQLAEECQGIDDPLAMLAWRTSPRVEEWVWIVSSVVDMSSSPRPVWGEITTPTMRDIAGAIRLGFDRFGEIWPPPLGESALICSGRKATDLIGARVVDGGR